MTTSEKQTKTADSLDKGDFHDTIVIGSSPALLLEAIHLSRQGNRVTILESKNRLGGAWYGQDLWDLGHIDVGCHYIDRQDYTFQLLTKFLDLPCDRQRYDCLWHSGSPHREGNSPPTIMSRMRNLLMKWLMADRLVNADLWWLLRSISMLKFHQWPQAFSDCFLKGPRLFPRDGAHGFASAIITKIEESSIQVITNTKVDSIVVHEDEATAIVYTEDSCYSTTQVVTGQNANFQVLQAGKCLLPNRQHYFASHVLLRVAGHKQRSFDFIDIIDSPATSLRRIQDVTPYAVKHSNSKRATSRRASRSQRANDSSMKALWGKQDLDLQHDDLLICCQHSNQVSPEEKHALALLDQLKQLRLITAESRLVGWHFETYRTLGDPSGNSIGNYKVNLPKQIRVMYTDDMSESLTVNQDRWHFVA